MAGQERRNPYVILGTPFGVSGEKARSGFAKMSRRLRQNPDSRYTHEDLTWALHQVEEIITKPELAFEVFRIPASPSVFNNEETGVFHPAPHRADRVTQPDADQWDLVRRKALSAALRRVMRYKVPKSTEFIPYE